MFQAVREWWGSGRGKMTVRLFAFEFVVVVAGVLVAQGLANWVAERAVRQEARQEEARIRYEIGRARQSIRVWDAAIPCLRQRVDLMLRAANTGSPRFSEDDLVPPRMWGYNVEPISLDIERPLRDLVGVAVLDAYGGIIYQSTGNRAERMELKSEWAKFGLLAAADGGLSDGERDSLRAAAVRIRFLLSDLEDGFASLDEDGRRLGIEPIGSGAELPFPDNPVTSCDEIWRNKDLFHRPANQNPA